MFWISSKEVWKCAAASLMKESLKPLSGCWLFRNTWNSVWNSIEFYRNIEEFFSREFLENVFREFWNFFRILLYKRKCVMPLRWFVDTCKYASITIDLTDWWSCWFNWKPFFTFVLRTVVRQIHQYRLIYSLIHSFDTIFIPVSLSPYKIIFKLSLKTVKLKEETQSCCSSPPSAIYSASIIDNIDNLHLALKNYLNLSASHKTFPISSRESHYPKYPSNFKQPKTFKEISSFSKKFQHPTNETTKKGKWESLNQA
jgi:hypothetical protein